MRYEGRTLEEALERAAAAVGRPADDLQYRIVEDKKGFWGSRRVTVELITDGKVPPRAAPPPRPQQAVAPDEVDEAAAAEAERAAREIVEAAGLELSLRRLEGASFEVSGPDVELLLARRGEGLEALQTLVGRIAGRRLGRSVFPRFDAEGFRQHRREALEELARAHAERVKRSGRKVLLDPMSPAERRLIHLALAADEAVETRSEGEGFYKRVAILPRG